METHEVWKVWSAALIVVVLLVGGWALYWKLNRSAIDHRYENNLHSQQYQAGLIAGARDQVTAWTVATDPAQKVLIGQQFCVMAANISPAPADIAVAITTICEETQ